MDYKTKVKLIDEGLERLNNGESMDDIREYLSGPRNELKDTDVFTVVSGIKRQLSLVNKEKIEEYILAGKKDSIEVDFGHLEKEVREEFVASANKKIKNTIKKNIKERLRRNMNAEEIFNELKSDYIPDISLKMTIDEIMHQKVDFQAEKGKSILGLFIGPILVVVGVVLTAGSTMIFYGLIGVGIIVTIRGISALIQRY